MSKRVFVIIVSFIFTVSFTVQVFSADTEQPENVTYIEPIGGLSEIHVISNSIEEETVSNFSAFSDNAYLSVTLPDYGYFYSLNDKQKDVYKRIKYAIDTYSFDKIYFNGTLTRNELGETYTAVLYDNPEYFWMYGGYSYSYQTEDALISITLYSYYYTTLTNTNANGYSYGPGDETKIKEAQSLVNEGYERFFNDCSGSFTDAQNARIIHDNLVNFLNYDIVATTNEGKGDFAAHSIYGAFADTTATQTNGTVVCDGYSKAYKFLLDKYGIKSYVVSGVATNTSGSSGNHAWNVVEIDGVWYCCDVTWNDPLGQENTMSNILRYDFFNTNCDFFDDSHVVDPGENCCSHLSPQGSDKIIEAIDYTYPGCNDFVYISDSDKTLYEYNGVGGIVRLEPGTTVLNNYLFFDNDSITELHIPSSVTTLANNCITECTRLNSIYFYGNKPSSWVAGAIKKVGSNPVLYHITSRSGWTDNDGNDNIFTVGSNNYSFSSFSPDVIKVVNMKSSGASETVVSLFLEYLLKG